MICKVSTNENIADPLTKALAQGKDDHHTNSMGIRYMYDLAQYKWMIINNYTLSQITGYCHYLKQRHFYYIVCMFTL